MRWLFAAAAFLALQALPAAAQPTAPPEITPALFVVRDADSTLYLYGTIHELPPNAQWSNASVRTALESAEEIWVESDPSEERAVRFVTDLTTSLLTPSDQSLTECLPARYRPTMRYLAKHSELDVDGLEPWQAALLFIASSSQADARTSLAGVDTQVVTTARERGTRLRWLEELDASDFAGLPYETQLEFLMYVLDGVNSPPGEVAAMEAMWANGDLDGLYEREFQVMRTTYPALYGWIAVARNNAWMGILVRELEGAGVDFVAVGTAHLLGAEGLVEQMRARGYAVERVQN